MYSLPSAKGAGSNSFKMISPGCTEDASIGVSLLSGVSGVSGIVGSSGISGSVGSSGVGDVGAELVAPGVPPRGSVDRYNPVAERSQAMPAFAFS